ncbi:L-2,4-diaminobutyrate decarboxylase [Aspergillus pseudotamarii]|uniref:L-2,4-diaminobutyrate decarboxylase n=1 Tax=Aspergillus pseudotamarii TaxID=132259 RepID=A0A5N6T9W9_ASPPS|nr:L-2,4-diaminobutyrate decarboxylase [Aspergillus pseudotamarii]KAE8143103.1 L-2,4-diaminobutyrate decarboxylase [Aspergillus pseudotamarii]
MGSNGPEGKPDDGLSEIMLEAESFLTKLLTINPPVPSDPIVRKLNTHEIQHMQHEVMPDDHPRDLPSVLQEAMAVFDNRMRLTHPHCFSYIPACPTPLAYLGDLLTSICNVNAASWDVSSGPSAVEKAMIAWLGAQLGLPDSVGGCFVSGGSMANMAAIIAARDEVLQPRQRGDAVIYISDQTHISILKALHITGFMDYQVHKIPTDDEFRIDVDILRRAIITDRESGRVPFLLVANCGSTNTGSIDPLHALADLARDEGIWLHVDGAYGASIALSDTHRDLIDGIGRADSVSWDGHKWLFQTYGCGIVLTRDVRSLRRSFAVDAEYISSTLAPRDNTNFYNLGPELSRPARAMSLWLTLRTLGRQRMGEMIDQGFLLARTADDNIRQYKNWIIPAPTVASIVVFRYAPPGFDEEELDILNKAISQRLLSENIAAILTTKIRGRTTLRMCAMNPLVKPETIEDLIRQVDILAQSEASRRHKTYSKMAKMLHTHCQERPGLDVFQDDH